jgi:hypothetical protein
MKSGYAELFDAAMKTAGKGTCTDPSNKEHSRLTSTPGILYLYLCGQ